MSAPGQHAHAPEAMQAGHDRLADPLLGLDGLGVDGVVVRAEERAVQQHHGCQRDHVRRERGQGQRQRWTRPMSTLVAAFGP